MSKTTQQWLLIFFPGCTHCPGREPATKSCILVGEWLRSRSQVDLWGAGEAVQEGSKCLRGCVWPEAWRQNDAGASTTPRLVAELRGLYANRSVSKVRAHWWDWCRPPELGSSHKTWRMEQREPHRGFTFSLPSSHKPDCLQRLDNDMIIKSQLLTDGSRCM